MTLPQLWRFLAIALPILASLIAPLPSVDLAFQLRAGREILTTVSIPTVDTWTFTAAGQPWVDQPWLAQVLLYLSSLASWTGLVVLRAALVGATFWLLLDTIRARAPRLGPRLGALLVVAAFIVSAPALALRPQLFAIALFALTLWILAGRRARPRLVWAIPVLIALWATLHGSFPLPILLVGVTWVGDLAGPADAATPQSRFGRHT